MLPKLKYYKSMQRAFTTYQGSLFPTKDSFDSTDFERFDDQFKILANCIQRALDNMNSDNLLLGLTNTTKSNILHDKVIQEIEDNQEHLPDIKVFKSNNRSKRSFLLLDDKYILFCKKFPVSNINTKRDLDIKNQNLDKHVLFLTYIVDDFWNSIERVKFQYFINKTTVNYSYDIDTTSGVNFTSPMTNDDSLNLTGVVKLKDNLSKKTKKTG